MLRIVAPLFRAAGAARVATAKAGNSNLGRFLISSENSVTHRRCLAALYSSFGVQNDPPCFTKSTLLSEPLSKRILPAVLQPVALPERTLTKFSMRKGKRKAVKAVIKRFYRLAWGGWIRTKSGRHKKLWKKSPTQKRRLRQHVLVNGTQAWLLDTMVTSYWRRRKYYVDDPYEPYHTREEFFITRKKPVPPLIK